MLAAALLASALVPTAHAAQEPRGYTKVYEPETSLPLAATVCWRASTGSIASEEAPPSSVLVYVDASLRVFG
ncbi:MAG TPA: hypothetical protein VLA21_07825, partial [Candidatus Limnocylindria bacterium]|nr:hypothetical protein [Candidatus Limnocylindria bacterium]